MGKRVLFIFPQGLIYNRDSVRYWDDGNPVKDAKYAYNSGDMFVTEASLKLMDFDHVESVLVDVKVTDEAIARYNAEFDYCVFRGSNCLHEKMVWGNVGTFIEKIKLPVIGFSIGAQAPRYEKVQLNEETKRVMACMADRAASVGVRGAFTAEVLNDHGIKNVDVIGCPSFMRHNNPDLRIDLGPLDKVRNVGFSITRSLSRLYAENVARGLMIQREAMLDLAQKYNLTVVSQSEIPEKIYYHKLLDRLDEAYASLIESGWFQGKDDPMVKLYEQRMFFGSSALDYEVLMRNLDLMVGTRLHGNAMAVANGKPAIYITLDSRLRELVDLLCLPRHDITNEKPFRIEDYWHQEIFDRFNVRYREMYSKMKQFLDLNGVANRMVDLDWVEQRKSA
jgi:hypothetical protein